MQSPNTEFHQTVQEPNGGFRCLFSLVSLIRRLEVYEGGSGLAFHFDKDEHFFKSEQIMRHPYLSSVLYLTGSDSDRLRQGNPK